MLINNFPREDLYYASRECRQFFDLFSKLIEEYYNCKQNITDEKMIKMFEVDPINPMKLFIEIVDKLKKHDTKEKKSSLLEDKILIGYIDMTKVI
jgi:hypothetical protein